MANIHGMSRVSPGANANADGHHVVRRRNWTAPLIAIALALKSSVASACMVCIELPDETLTDRIWNAQTVALARPAADNAYSYEAIEVLRGGTDDPIPFLVNSTARSKLQRDRDAAALVIRMPDGTWFLGGLGGVELSRFAADVLRNERAWTDQANDPDRVAAFRALHAANSPALRRLALTELSRVRYDDLRDLDVAISVDWIAPRLFDPGWFGWQPIMVHMLGLHPDPRAQQLIRRHALQINAANRVPWLVALIEVDGQDAVERVLAQAMNGEKSYEVARAAIQALTIHAEANPELAPSLTTALRQLASDDADLAAEAVRGFLYLEDYSMAPDVTRILDRGRVQNPASAFVLNHYVALARAEQALLDSGAGDTAAVAEQRTQ